jgi:hypothetical protein
MNEVKGDPFGFSAAGQRCFTCGQFLSDPALMWSGYTDGPGNVYWHSSCALVWAPKLVGEAHQLIALSSSSGLALTLTTSTSTSNST